MIRFNDGGYRILPHEMEMIKKAQEVEKHLLRGFLVTYEEAGQVDEMSWHDILRRNEVEEVPGEGYRMAE